MGRADPYDWRVPTSQDGRCAECGFPWDIAVDDAVAMVGGSPDLMAQALRFGDPSSSGRPGVWSPAEYLWHMVDVVRIGAERLWTLALDPDAGVPAWDENDLARVRHYPDLSPRAAVAAYARAVADWMAAAAEAPPDATTVHSELGPITTADVIRTNAHEAQHHLLDIEQTGRRPSANVFIARSVAQPGGGPDAEPDGGRARGADGGRIFDDYVMVDWSANSTPRTGKDSIWIATGAWRRDTLRGGRPRQSGHTARRRGVPRRHAVRAPRCATARGGGIRLPLLLPGRTDRRLPRGVRSRSGVAGAVADARRASPRRARQRQQPVGGGACSERGVGLPAVLGMPGVGSRRAAGPA